MTKILELIFKCVESLLPILTIIFTVLGVIIGGYLTISFRAKSLLKLDDLKEINIAIDESLGKLSDLNSKIANS